MKILLADDHVLFREGLRLILRKFDKDIELIEADSYAEAARMADSTSSLDLVLLDLRMPGVNGMDGLIDMCRRVGETPVVIISGAYAQPDITRAFQCGAAGFISKTLGSRAMYSAINLVLSGERYVPSSAFFDDIPTTQTPPALAHSDPPGAGAASDPFATLTPRERDVLGLLVQGLSNRQIAEELRLQEVSVRVRLTSIFKKLGVTSRTQAVGLSIRNGFPT